jgi:hypothetical protein
MAGKKRGKSDGEVQELAGTGNTVFQMTKEHAGMLQSLVYHQQKIKLAQEAYSDDVKATAAKIGAKPGEIKEMVGWLIMEQQKGGVIESKEQKLELVRQVLTLLDNTPEDSAS